MLLLGLLNLLCSLGLAGPRGPSRAALEEVVALAEAGGEQPLDELLVDALIAPNMGALPEACASKLREGRAATTMSDRAFAYAEALRDLCPPTCAGDALGQLVVVPEDKRLQTLIDACDARGPDPVFNTPALAAERLNMDGMAFLLLRLTLDPVFKATAGTPLGDRYAALGPALVAAMTHRPTVEFNPPVVEGGVPLDDAWRQANASVYAVTACYTEALRSAPGLRGQIAVTAYVDAVGRTISGVEGALPDALLLCVDEVVRTQWRFSAPLGDELGKVQLTFTLSPD